MYINGCRSVTSGCLNVFDPVMNKQWLFFCPQGDHVVIKFVDKETLLKEKQQQLEVYFWSVPSYVRLCNCCVYLLVTYSARFYIFGLGTREEAETEGGSQKEVGSGKGLTGDIVFCSWARHFFSNNSLTRLPWKSILQEQIYATPMYLTCRGITFPSVAQLCRSALEKASRASLCFSLRNLFSSFIHWCFFFFRLQRKQKPEFPRGKCLNTKQTSILNLMNR